MGEKKMRRRERAKQGRGSKRRKVSRHAVRLYAQDVGRRLRENKYSKVFRHPQSLTGESRGLLHHGSWDQASMNVKRKFAMRSQHNPWIGCLCGTPCSSSGRFRNKEHRVRFILLAACGMCACIFRCTTMWRFNVKISTAIVCQVVFIYHWPLGLVAAFSLQVRELLESIPGAAFSAY